MNAFVRGRFLHVCFVVSVVVTIFLSFIFPDPPIKEEDQTLYIALVMESYYVFINAVILWYYAKRQPDSLYLLLVIMVGVAIGNSILPLFGEFALWFVGVRFLTRVVGALACYQYFVRQTRKVKTEDKTGE